MKMYILTQADIDRLLLRVDRNPHSGRDGGSNDDYVNREPELEAHKKAHRFYNYQVRSWIDEVTK